MKWVARPPMISSHTAVQSPTPAINTQPTKKQPSPVCSRSKFKFKHTLSTQSTNTFRKGFSSFQMLNTTGDKLQKYTRVFFFLIMACMQRVWWSLGLQLECEPTSHLNLSTWMLLSPLLQILSIRPHILLFRSHPVPQCYNSRNHFFDELFAKPQIDIKKTTVGIRHLKESSCKDDTRQTRIWRRSLMSSISHPKLRNKRRLGAPVSAATISRHSRWYPDTSGDGFSVKGQTFCSSTHKYIRVRTM